MEAVKTLYCTAVLSFCLKATVVLLLMTGKFLYVTFRKCSVIRDVLWGAMKQECS